MAVHSSRIHDTSTICPRTIHILAHPSPLTLCHSIVTQNCNLDRRWDATEDQMLGAMHMLPPARNPKKSVSLLERMMLQKPSWPHASVCSPDAQPTGQCQAAPQTNTSTTDPLLSSALENPPPSAGPSGQYCPPLDEACGQVHSAVRAAACRPVEAGKSETSEAMQSHDGLSGSDDDMTQEDMPTEAACLELPDLGEVTQHLHQQPSPKQSMDVQQAQSEVATRQPHARHEESAQPHQQAIGGGSAEDKVCWEQALEAEMQSLSDNADDDALGQPNSDPNVIQLDVGSADDLLDVLADAAAEMPLARCRQVQDTVLSDGTTQSFCIGRVCSTGCSLLPQQCMSHYPPSTKTT